MLIEVDTFNLFFQEMRDGLTKFEDSIYDGDKAKAMAGINQILRAASESKAIASTGDWSQVADEASRLEL